MHPLLRLTTFRVFLGIVTLFVVSLIIFFSVNLQPGDFAQTILGQEASPETVAALRHDLGLDLPTHVRSFNWITNFFQGDLGRSLANKSLVSVLIAARLWNPLFLAAVTAIIAVPPALLLGIIAAIRRNSWLDRLINILVVTAVSV